MIDRTRFAVHFNINHKPTKITKKKAIELEPITNEIRKQLLFEIKLALKGSKIGSLNASISIPCSELVYLSLFYKIDTNYYKYKFYPLSNSHVHQFICDNDDIDRVIRNVGKVLGIKNDDDSWIRRIYSGYCSYIAINPSNKSRNRIEFRSIVKRVEEENQDEDEIMTHSARYVRITFPTYYC